jgi:pyruvate dehydrogenase E2 component (dihydrolipoamide acetyltransferase)
MPQMGYDMREGTVVRWLKSEESEVKLGEAIAEIETDKAVVELESTASGTLRMILVAEGTTVPVGQPIAIIGAADEELPETVATAVSAPEAPGAEAAGIPLPPSPAQAEEPAAPVQETRASPVARRLAEERGIDLGQVVGTGPGGRITRDDVLAFEPAEPPVKAAPAPPVEVVLPPSGAPSGEKVPISRMRQQIARVTVRSKREIPHFYVSAEIDMTQAMEMRVQVNAGLEREGTHVSVNDLIIKACVGTLKRYPKFNATFAEDGIQMNDTINVGIAIAEEEGLIVPAIMDCASKSLAEIAKASKDLIERSKSGTLHPQEYAGGTFSISNLGMFDVSNFVAIIQPPQAAVLAVGRVARRPVVRNGEVAIAEMMTGTLSADHRVADGAEGAQFIIEVKKLLENPFSLLV